MAVAEPSHREIERKFSVRKLPDALEQFPNRLVEQGYLATGPNGLQVRLRRSGDKLSLTYKRDDAGGRIEREVELTPEQFDVLWPATEGRRLTKTRYDVPHGDRTVEIDIYRGRHEGLIVAEVEFPDEHSARAFQPPDWLGEDVTGKPRYSNVRLACD
ncbi:MAG TPA: CYTH domain-containing protein [Thermoanaerobaculia bacterium]